MDGWMGGKKGGAGLQRLKNKWDCQVSMAHAYNPSYLGD
jgi:hypothetical protein